MGKCTPRGTKFAVIIHDEDAPTGIGWWHWLIFDIPDTVKELKSGTGTVKLQIAPEGSVQSKTDFGTTGYGGPCPPEGCGVHKYTITLFALKIPKLGLDMQANPALVGFYLEQNVIEKASLVFYCKK